MKVHIYCVELGKRIETDTETDTLVTAYYGEGYAHYRNEEYDFNYTIPLMKEEIERQEKLLSERRVSS